MEGGLSDGLEREEEGVRAVSECLDLTLAPGPDL